jgi:hypothetical protein
MLMRAGAPPTALNAAHCTPWDVAQASHHSNGRTLHLLDLAATSSHLIATSPHLIATSSPPHLKPNGSSTYLTEVPDVAEVPQVADKLELRYVKKKKMPLQRIFVPGVVCSSNATHFPPYRLGSSWLEVRAPIVLIVVVLMCLLMYYLIVLIYAVYTNAHSCSFHIT